MCSQQAYTPICRLALEVNLHIYLFLKDIKEDTRERMRLPSPVIFKHIPIVFHIIGTILRTNVIKGNNDRS